MAMSISAHQNKKTMHTPMTGIDAQEKSPETGSGYSSVNSIQSLFMTSAPSSSGNATSSASMRQLVNFDIKFNNDPKIPACSPLTPEEFRIGVNDFSSPICLHKPRIQDPHRTPQPPQQAHPTYPTVEQNPAAATNPCVSRNLIRLPLIVLPSILADVLSATSRISFHSPFPRNRLHHGWQPNSDSFNKSCTISKPFPQSHHCRP